MADVARLAEVSVGTVSAVLNLSPTVRPRSRERVQEAMRALDYHPNQIARSLKMQCTHTIRYYHQSSKVFNLQNSTREIVGALGAVAPEERSFGHPFFNDLLREGTGRAFSLEDNDDWQERVGPILHAFFHARFFLEMAVKYAQVLEMPDRLPSGWAALLYLYGLR